MCGRLAGNDRIVINRFAGILASDTVKPKNSNGEASGSAMWYNSSGACRGAFLQACWYWSFRLVQYGLSAQGRRTWIQPCSFAPAVSYILLAASRAGRVRCPLICIAVLHAFEIFSLVQAFSHGHLEERRLSIYFLASASGMEGIFPAFSSNFISMSLLAPSSTDLSFFESEQHLKSSPQFPYHPSSPPSAGLGAHRRNGGDG
ncbi:hypothetical protein Nepgr_001370 [Nepenthes gracilis]|uniref:Uncharacterized protein n=1 Tax=Nepenthes gracilis TaxID=150966 RepID=A0AAD3P4C1_NEPGR|nr:hypothetical protein Nepgr_001370 [Nepenthes gracilis]